MVPKIEMVLREGDEEAIGFFNTVGCNPPEDPVFRNAFPGSFWIRHCIPGAGVKESMIASRSSGGEISLLD
jgi:hypothetical protein